MRKLTLTLSTFFICFLVTGQINVDSNGDVTIGNTYDAPRTLDVDGDTYIDGHVGIGITPSTYYDLQVGSYVRPYSNALKVYGFTEFDTDYIGIDIKTGPSQYELSIYPDGNNYGTVGTFSQAFNSVFAYNYPIPSDIRQKENIKEIDNALSIIMQLTGVTYDLKKEYAYIDSIPYTAVQLNKLEKRRKNIYGFIAQDVEKILPTTVHYDDTTDTYAIDYVKVIPVLASAIKEQNSIIENLQAEISSLKNSNLKFLATNGEDKNIDDQHILYQNAPNPFSENTIISYFLSDGFDDAQIIIYDMTGLQLNSISLNDVGESNVEISAGEFKAGMYIYSLIVDGKLFDSKQMIITE